MKVREVLSGMTMMISPSHLMWMLEVPKSLGMRTPSLEGPMAVRKLGAVTSTDIRSASGFSRRHLTMSWWFFIMLEGTLQLRLLATLTA